MKTKIYIGVLATMLIPGLKAEAQNTGAVSSINDNAGITINNYYNYDFHYSSRINRFHRSYVAFDYYSPVYTDVYWYSYQPFTWGVTIYGGGRVGVTYNYPVYYSYWDIPWYYGWDYGWLGGTYWWRYDPFYVPWYNPVIINVRIGGWWPVRYYSYHMHNRWYGDYRPVYNTYNYYYYNYPTTTSGTSVNYSRRNVPSTTTTTVAPINNRSGSVQHVNTDNQGRRGVPANQGNRVFLGDQGSNNSLDPGNAGNVNRGVNSGNNPGRRNVPANSRGDQGNVYQGNQGISNPANINNANRGGSYENNSGRRTESTQVNRSQNNEITRLVAPVPSENRNQTGISAPVRYQETRRPVDGTTSSVNTGRTVSQPRQATLSRSSGQSNQSIPAVRPSGNTSESTRQGSSGSVSKSSGNQESNRNSQENTSPARRR